MRYVLVNTPALQEQVEDLLRKNSRVGVHDLAEDEVEDAVSAFTSSLTNPLVLHHATLNDRGEMMSYLSQVLPKCGEYWLMSFLCTNPELKLGWDNRTNGLDMLWARAFAVGSLHGVHKAVWSLPKRWANANERTTTKYSDLWRYYKVTTFAEVEAGTLPPQDHMWAFGTKPKPYDVVLRSCVHIQKTFGVAEAAKA